MATIHPFTKDDFRTIAEIKKGFVNGMFKQSEMITDHLKNLFGDAELTLHDNPNNNTLTIECKSYEWCASKYNRVFVFHYITKSNGNKQITDVEEI